jgi:hypothetical protein
MRIIVCLLVTPFLLLGQAPTGGAATNLKLLAPNTNIPAVMQDFAESLGAGCNYCHVPNDFSSDANPKKEVARKMIAMVRVIDNSFPSTSGVFPAGYHEVDCMTCHRGNAKPEVKAPQKFYNRTDAGEPARPDRAGGISLQVLPQDAIIHGSNSIMADFRDALNVDCSYCHGGGKPVEADVNPRKDIARKMITLVREINANFPGTGVFPAGAQEVTCYTCHRGDPHPVSLGNKRYARKQNP